MEIARRLEEAKRKEKQLLLAVEEEELATSRKKKDRYKKLAFERYFDLDPDLVLAWRYFRKLVVSV